MLIVNGFTRQSNLNCRQMLGFSIIELMIAMSLSLVLMLSVYKVFDVQQRGFELISALNDREDNAQLAMKVLSDSIRLADYWGGVNAQEVTRVSGSLSAAPGACDTDWVFNVSQSILGLEGDSSVQGVQDLPLKCLKNTDYVASSDLLALRFADSHEYFQESEIDNKRYQQHYFVRAQAGKGANLFQGKHLALAVETLPNEGFHYNMLFHSSLFFLRPCQKASNDCEEGSSVLSRLVLKGDRYIQEALVEGVEQLQFEYGVDEDLDKVLDHYVSANKVHDWQSVVSIRIFLLVRGRLPDISHDEKGKRYLMSSSGSQNDNVYTVPDSARFYPRKLYQSEVTIRNRLVE